MVTLGTKKKRPDEPGDILKEHMKFSMTGQEKYDLLIEVTAWAGLTGASY